MNIASSSLSSRISLKITPSATPHRFLGGGGLPHTTVDDNNDARSGHGGDDDSTGKAAYAALPRPTKLPPPTFKLNINNKDIEAVFMKIWDGDFQAICELNEQGVLVISGGYSNDDDDSSYDIPTELQGTVIAVGLSCHDSEISMINEKIPLTFHNEEFGSVLTETHKVALCYRMLHHVVRSHGTCLSGGYEMAQTACKSLIAAYVSERRGDTPTGLKKKFFHEALDAIIIMTDLAIRFGDCSNTTIACRLKAVGEHLEAVEMYSQGAEIYLYAVDHCNLDDHENRSDGYCCAGLAYERNGQLLKGEEQYISALYHANRLPNRFDLHDERTTAIFNNLLSLYETQDLSMFCAGTKRDQFYPSLTGLLFMAGFEPGEGTRNIMNTGATKCYYLRPEYQCPRRAKLALDLATRKPNRKHFRETIIKCWDPETEVNAHYGGYMDKNGNILKEKLQERDKERKRMALESARRAVTENVISLHKSRCSNPSCTGFVTENGANLGCPCKAMYYCSKSCQGEHWNVHKTFCPWHNRGKENAQCKHVV